MKEIFKFNNFDLIRLFAAFQVAINHAMTHLEIGNSGEEYLAILNLFPGVPIFFFVSGFLISKSYEKNPILNEYAQNRILRIYPALITCTFFALISVCLSGYLQGVEVNANEIVIWILGQISFVQFYNPDFMRGFGTGVLNGSLWTITVELQFYILVPILYWMFGLAKPTSRNSKIIILIIFFMLFHIARTNNLHEYSENFIFKIFGVSFAPWIYMFLVGVLFQKNFNILYGLLSGKALYVLCMYLFLSYFAVNYLGWKMGNGINPLIYFLLAVLIFSFAYSYPSLSRNLLRGNDISYGVYIYHIPIINLLIYYGYTSKPVYVSMALMITILMALTSWVIIEKTSMRLKKHPLNPLGSSKKHEKTSD